MRRKFSIFLGFFIILFSVTTIYAQGSLKSWYMDNFHEKSAENSTEIAKKVTSLEKQIHTQLEQASQEIDTILAEFLASSAAMSEEEITSHMEQYEHQLDDTKQQLVMNLDFETFVEEETEKTEEDFEQITIRILRDLLDQ